MKMTRKTAWLVASAAMIASTHAAIISFAGPVAATNTAVLDTQWAAGGTLEQAANIGGPAKSFTTAGGQSITFAAMQTAFSTHTVMPAASPAANSGIYNAGIEANVNLFSASTDVTAWGNVLQSQAYHHWNSNDNDSPLTLHLANLMIGQEYSVSLFTSDMRAGNEARTEAYYSSFAPTANFGGGTSGAFSTATAGMVVGTFTADATYQDVFIKSLDGGNNSTIEAYTLYSIPEPATMGLIGVFGIGMLFVRRRLML